jgi:hypothetical protein
MSNAAEKQEIQVIPPAASTAITPMSLLNQAVANGNIELAERLMTLQERFEKNEARKSFDNAMASAKASIPVIFKNRQVNYGNTNYSHEDLAEISRTIDPILASVGLSYRFRTLSDNTTVTVTCIISHRDGHAEENSLTGAHDVSGSKNKIQAVGSTITYLQRYTLKAALGLSAAADDDARKGKRQNPHVTEPSDVIEPIEQDEQGNPINNIPLGDPEVTRLSKAMAKPEFAAMQSEIRAIVTEAALKTWGDTNANRVATLPYDWQEFLRDVYRGQLTHLKSIKK